MIFCGVGFEGGARSLLFVLALAGTAGLAAPLTALTDEPLPPIVPRTAEEAERIAAVTAPETDFSVPRAS